MKPKEKEKILRERNNKLDAFKKDEKTQEERDQLIMPVDELPLEDIKYEVEEEKNKKETKKRSSSEKEG